MDIYTVDPWAVDLGNFTPYPRDVRMQMARLEREGQIEPIQMLDPRKSPSGVALRPDLDEWCYAREQVTAARQLGWPTILITY